MGSEANAGYAAVRDSDVEEYSEDAYAADDLTHTSVEHPWKARSEQHDNGNEDGENAPFIEGRKDYDEDVVHDTDDDDQLHDPMDDESVRDETLEEKEESKSTLYLFILTLGIVGLQVSWTTELSYGSPFLLSLGISKAVLSFVWIAGPLMGVLVQPYVGILSDRSQSRWGKRRPFMVVGAISTALSFMCLCWAREIVQGFLGIFGANAESHGVKTSVIVWAVVWVYVLDFAINAVQAAIRAFIVDNAPTHQQEVANAWAGRLTGFGSIIGYLSGYVELPRHFPFFGDTQFKVLCMLSSLLICITVFISCVYIKERDPRLDGPIAGAQPLGLISFFKQTYRSMLRLPPRIRKVCEVQFFNWFGWFPFLFYITTFIGQLYVNPIFEDHPNLEKDDVDRYWEEGIRVGSLALFVNAIVSFIASIILPILVVPSYRSIIHHQSTHTTNASNMSQLLRKLRIPNFTLRRAWLLSQVFFAFCMGATFFATTPAAGSVVVALVGISWAISMWAPFALIAAEISKRDALRRVQSRRRQDHVINNTEGTSLTRSFNTHHKDMPQNEDDQAGVVLGLHNVSVSAPQILATLISSGIFKLLQRDRGVAGDDSIGWVLRFAGLSALAAAFMTWRLKEENEEPIAGDEGERQSVIAV